MQNLRKYSLSVC